MGSRVWTVMIAVVVVGVAAALGASAARADVGVEKVSRHSGRPGAELHLTLACGFCFPPCVGPKGERHPKGYEHGPCMLDSDREPPASFGVSLASRDRAERLVACNVAGGHCPTPTRAPRRHGFHFLGEATPPPGGNDPAGGDPPRYELDFAVPDLPAGEYSYVIWCDACLGGRAGSLVASPMAPLWRLAIPAPDQRVRRLSTRG